MSDEKQLPAFPLPTYFAPMTGPSHMYAESAERYSQRQQQTSLEYERARAAAWEARCRLAVEALRGIRPESGDRYYQFRKYMRHIDGCTGGGDHFCKCGMAQTAMSVDDCIGEARLEIDKAIALIGELPSE